LRSSLNWWSILNIGCGQGGNHKRWYLV
jgi:hypothetical protein